MKKISPEKFTFEKYVGRIGYTVNDVLTTRCTAQPGVKLLGYCLSYVHTGKLLHISQIAA